MKKITVCEQKCGLHFLKTNVTMEKQPFEDISPIKRIQSGEGGGVLQELIC